MRIENLEEGMMIKNYKELCNVLEMKVMTSNSKKAQLKELDRYCEIRREGNRFIVEKIRSTPLDKIENRGKASKSNNSIYIEDIENILLYIMNYQDKNKLTISKSKALEMVNMVNDRYNYGRQNMKSEAKALGIDEMYINDFFMNNHSQLTNIFERALKVMKNKALIIWETRYYVYDGREYRLATNKEKQLIAEYQQVFLQLNNCKTLSDAFLRGMLKDIKRAVVDSINNEINTNIKFYYEGYEINISKQGVERELNLLDVNKHIEELNFKIALKIINSTEKRKVNIDNKPRFGEGRIDTLNPYNRMKLSDEYVNIHAELVDRYIIN